MSLAGARGYVLPLLFEPMFCIPSFCYFVTKLPNKERVVCEFDIISFSLSNHVIRFILLGRQRCALSRT